MTPIKTIQQTIFSRHHKIAGVSFSMLPTRTTPTSQPNKELESLTINELLLRMGVSAISSKAPEAFCNLKYFTNIKILELSSPDTIRIIIHCKDILLIAKQSLVLNILYDTQSFNMLPKSVEMQIIESLYLLHDQGVLFSKNYTTKNANFKENIFYSLDIYDHIKISFRTEQHPIENFKTETIHDHMLELLNERKIQFLASNICSETQRTIANNLPFSLFEGNILSPATLRK